MQRRSCTNPAERAEGSGGFLRSGKEKRRDCNLPCGHAIETSEEEGQNGLRRIKEKRKTGDKHSTRKEKIKNNKEYWRRKEKFRNAGGLQCFSSSGYFTKKKKERIMGKHHIQRWPERGSR